MRCYKVASSVLGHRATVHCHVHDSRTALIASAEAFTGETFGGRTLAVTQAWWDHDQRATQVLVQLSEEDLKWDVISHEMAHAAHALYGATLSDNEAARTHLTHFNEPLAHLHTELFIGLINQLRRH